MVGPKPNGKGGSKRTIIATYDYVDGDGGLLYQVVRFEPKHFSQRRPSPDEPGVWVWGLTAGEYVRPEWSKDWYLETPERLEKWAGKIVAHRTIEDEVAHGLYRFVELREEMLQDPADRHTIHLAEGEKDCDTLAEWGLAATTNSGGARKWRPHHSEHLRGAEVVVCVDNDEAGLKHEKVVTASLHGVAARVRVLRWPKHWPGAPDGADITKWRDQAGGTRDKLLAIIDRLTDWVPAKANGKDDRASFDSGAKANGKDEAPPPLPFINMSRWDDEPVPRREWAVLDRIPLRQVTLHSGHGAAGKSLIELQRTVAHVLGKDWLYTLPEPGPALFIDAEDDEREQHIRLGAILKHHNATYADVVASGLHMMSFAGKDAVLAAASRTGKIEPTALYEQLLQFVGDIKPRSIAIASVANIFAGSENDRSQVQQCVSLLTGLAIAANGGLVLISHPSLTGIKDDTGLSGSTAWHNSVRARYFTRGVKQEEGEQPNNDVREIVFKKNNYGPVSTTIVVQYKNGLFQPVPKASSLDQVARNQTVDGAYLKVLRHLTEQGQDLGIHLTASNYAPKVIAAHPDAKDIRKQELEAAQQRLLDAGKVHIATFGPPSKERKYLRPGPPTNGATT